VLGGNVHNFTTHLLELVLRAGHERKGGSFLQVQGLLLICHVPILPSNSRSCGMTCWQDTSRKATRCPHLCKLQGYGGPYAPAATCSESGTCRRAIPADSTCSTGRMVRLESAKVTAVRSQSLTDVCHTSLLILRAKLTCDDAQLVR
jgi:hypothetical protein